MIIGKAADIKFIKDGELVPLPKNLFSQKALPGVCYVSQQAIDDYGEEFLKKISGVDIIKAIDEC